MFGIDFKILWRGQDTWVAQSVKGLAFSSGHDLRALGSSLVPSSMLSETLLLPLPEIPPCLYSVK